MRTEVSIGSIARRHVGDSLYDALLRAAPPADDAPNDQSYRWVFYEGDPKLAHLLALLEGAGLEPWIDHTRFPREGEEYPIIKRRIYEPTDLEGFQFLELLPSAFVQLDETDDGRLRMGRRVEGHSNDVLRQAYAAQRIVVSNKVRSVLEASNLHSVAFKPVYIDKQNNVSDRWSELTSPVRLPPLSPRMTLTDFDTRPVAPGYQGGTWIPQDGLVRPAELRYRASDLGKWKHDLALTTEGRIDSQRRMIASRRFYDVLLNAGITTDWLPVYIDE